MKLRTPAPESKLPSPSILRLFLSHRTYSSSASTAEPLSPPQASVVYTLLGFALHSMPTVRGSFLSPPTQHERGGRSPAPNKAKEERPEKRTPQPPPGSSRSPSPP